MKRSTLGIAALVIALTFSASIGASAAENNTYTDVPKTHWAANNIIILSDKNILAGYPDGSFKPNKDVTYGEFIKMAVLIKAKTDPGNSSSGHWAENYYNLALESEMFSEEQISKEKLGDPIPRRDMALIALSTAGDARLSEEELEVAYGKITDVDSGEPYSEILANAYGLGVVAGYTEGLSSVSLKPDKTLTRAEAATMGYRMWYGSYTKVNLSKIDPEKNQLSDLISGYYYYPDGNRIEDTWLYDNLKYYEILEEIPCTITVEKNIIGTEGLTFSGEVKSGTLIPGVESFENPEWGLDNYRKVLIIGDKAYRIESAPTRLIFYNVPDEFTFPRFDYVGLFLGESETIYLIPKKFVSK